MPTTDRTLRRAIREANQATHPNPSPKQVEAKNYPRGKIRMHGLHITIETPADGIRAGINKETGEAWEVRLNAPYGEITKAKGVDSVVSEADGDPLDVFIGDHPESEIVFVIDQNNAEGEFDECKIVLGCTNARDAVDLYHSNYSTGWTGFRDCTPMTIQQLYAWMRHGDTSKPLADQEKDFLKEASDSMEKMASFMRGISAGVKALTNAARSGAHMLADVQPGHSFRAAPAANTFKMLFRPSFGSVTKPVRYGLGAVGAGLTGAQAYGAFQEAKRDLKGAAIATQALGTTVPQLFDNPEAAQDWQHAMGVFHGIADNPLWAFRPTKHPEFGQLTEAGQAVTGKFLDEMRRHAFNNILDHMGRPSVRPVDVVTGVTMPAVPPIKKALLNLASHFKLRTQGSVTDDSLELLQGLSHTKQNSAVQATQMTKSAIVKKVGDEWLLYTKDMKRILGRHKTPGEAYGQEYAIQKSQERAMEKAAGGKPEFPDIPDCVAVDLDGTLAEHDPDKPFDPDHIGEPIRSRVEQVKKWVDAGIEVLIFTARATETKNIPVIEEWLVGCGLGGLQITNRKTPKIGLIIDDRAHHAPPNADKEFVTKAAKLTDHADMWDTRQKKFRLVDVQKLIELTKGRAHEEIPLASIWGGEQSSPGFSEDRVEAADTQYPILVDEYSEDPDKPVGLVDGRHRRIKLLRQGMEKGNIIRLTQDDLDAAAIPTRNKPTAVLITGNPQYIQGNSAASKFYDELERAIGERGFTVTRDPGEPHTAPPVADLWVGHSRGMGRLQFAPAGTKTLRVDDYLPEGHVDADGNPTASHYQLTPELLAQLGDTKQAAAMPEVEVPTTGPQAILHALKSLDTTKLEEKARQDLKAGSVQRHDKAVRLLGILSGLKRNQTEPHELMLTRVPVIPAAFRPFTTIGEVLVPGDANLLYQDVFRFRDAFRDAHDTLGPAGAGDARLALYDSIKAVFGFGDPVNPKTRAKGVQGFQRVITGSNPKHGFVQRKLISKPMDSVSRGVIVPDPDLDMDQIGIPASMAWPMYGSHVMGRMVRAGISEPLALKAVKDQTPDALQYLEQEMRERPVLYSRAPAWHKFNSIAGFPVLVDGDSIRISNMITSGMNADFDGDCKSLLEKDIWLIDNNPYYGRFIDLVALLDPKFPSLQSSMFEVAAGRLQVLSFQDGHVVWLPVSHVHFHTTHKTSVRVTSRSGFSLDTTDDHGMMTIAEDMTLKQVAPRALANGGIIPVAHKLGMPELVHTKQVGDDLTLPLNYDLGYLIGHYLGDGGAYDSASQVRLMSDDAPHQAALLARIESTGLDCSPIITKGKLKGYKLLSVSVWRWFRENFNSGCFAKRIASWMLTTPESFRRGVLDGMLSTDGRVVLASTAKYGKIFEVPNCNIGLASKDLVEDMATLCRTLGVSVNFETVKAPAHFKVHLALEDMPWLTLTHPGKNTELARMRASIPSRGYSKVVPFNRVILDKLKTMLGCGIVAARKKHIIFSSCYIKKGYVSLLVARDFVRQFMIAPPADEILMRWHSWIESTDVHWEVVEKVETLEREEVTFDVTVPGTHLTVGPVNGIITHQTLNIHVPALPKSIQEAKDRLLPSKMLFSIKDPDKTVPVPKHEMIWGTFAANNRKTGQVHRFGSRDLALKAVQTGQVDPADEVEFPD